MRGGRLRSAASLADSPIGSALDPKSADPALGWCRCLQTSRSVSLPTISPLRGLVEVTRLLRAREDLPALLDAVARTIGESLGYQTVAVNLYRPEWDDFQVTTVHGNEEARAMLLGNARPGDDWTVLLSDRFERRGAYDVPAGSVDWDSLGPSYVPQGGRACPPDAWDPEDALFVPMRDHRGLLLGIVSVDEPVSGRRPTDDDLEILVSLVDHAALAVEAVREAAESARHQRALEELLAVSSRITGETSTPRSCARCAPGSARRSTSATSAGRSSTRRPARSCRTRRPAGGSRTCAGASP